MYEELFTPLRGVITNHASTRSVVVTKIQGDVSKAGIFSTVQIL